MHEAFVIFFFPKFRFPASKNNDGSITEEFQVSAVRRKGNPESGNYWHAIYNKLCPCGKSHLNFKSQVPH